MCVVTEGSRGGYPSILRYSTVPGRERGITSHSVTQSFPCSRPGTKNGGTPCDDRLTENNEIDSMQHVRMNIIRTLTIVLLLMALLPGPAAAQTRALHWQSLEVIAHLDAEGALHVRETQAMVFNGNWNGGERRFDMRPGQKLQFEQLIERNAAGRKVRTLRRGDLKQVGEYRWFDDDVLRWRSRLPSDPQFRDALRIYELDYVISGVLLRQGQQYVLNHDFAFPDRNGIIEHFRGELTLDPAWHARAAFEPAFELNDVRPGRGVVRRVVLDYAGGGKPQAQRVAIKAPAWIVDLVSIVLAALAIGAAVIVIRRERERCRFEPIESPEAIDAVWLAEHVLRYRPEIVGAAWDGEVSTHEVMAVLARLALAGQITSEVKNAGWWIFKGDVLHMRLHVDAKTLPLPERKLIQKLFFDGDTTDTQRIRRHYRRRGFDAVGTIRWIVRSKAESIVGRDERLPAWRWKVTASLIGVGVLTIAIGVWMLPQTAPFVLPVAGGIVALWLVATQFARSYRQAPTPRFGAVLVVLILLVGGLFGLRWALQALVVPIIECIGLALLAAGMLHCSANHISLQTVGGVAAPPAASDCGCAPTCSVN